MKQFSRILLLLVCLSVLGCTKFGKQQRDSDPRTKYKQAIEYYENKEYLRAGILFQQILPVITGTPEGEEALYKYAYCHFYQGQYGSSMTNFRTFYESYFRNEKAEDALYMTALSQYRLTQPSNLDQSTTKAAISAFQEYINVYSENEKVADSEGYIIKLRAKLEKKDFDNAILFAKLEKYKSARICFTNFINDYPDSELYEDAYFHKFRSQAELSFASINKLKRDRINTAIEYHQQYVDKFKQGKFNNKAENIYKSLIKEIENLDKIEKEAELN